MKRDGDVLRAPGIGDDCRGLAMMMGVIQALNEAKVQTPGTITLAADTGEEGLGDLGGTKELFNVTLKGQIDKFISVDGTGLGITSVGVGSCRYRATFEFKLVPSALRRRRTRATNCPRRARVLAAYCSERDRRKPSRSPLCRNRISCPLA